MSGSLEFPTQLQVGSGCVRWCWSIWWLAKGGGAAAAVMEAALHAIESEAPEEGSPPGLGVTGAATGTVGGVDEATLQKSSALISALMSGNSGTVTTLSMALRGISKYGLEEWMSKFV